MPAEITMPQLSDTMTEGTLVKWLVKEGDPVKAGQIVAEVETDKATMEMESFESGTLSQIVAPEGTKVPVGGTIAIVGKAGEKIEKKADAAPREAVAATRTAPKGEAKSEAKAETSAPTPQPVAVQVKTQDFEVEPDRHAQVVKPGALSNGNGNGFSAHTGRIVASPLAKRIAADLGVDLTTIEGSGPNGRIVQADVTNGTATKKTSGVAASAATVSTAPKPAPEMPTRVASGQTEKIQLTKMRQVIAARLQQSKQTIPHFYETIDIDMTAAVELRKKLLEMYEKKEGIRVSIGDVVAKAVAATLKAVPQMNATYDEKSTTVTRYGDVNLGMAVALPDGLIVPVLRNIDQMGFKEIRVKSADIVDRARAQKLKREELSGATFTVSNLGLMGIREFSAIVNPPEVGILAIGESVDRVVVRDGQMVIRNMMTVTLSCDHRVIDGAVAAQFLGTLKGMLEVPALMLI